MILYRYDERDYGEGCHPAVRIQLYEYSVVRETPKGYWIRIPYYFGKKWVSNYTKKRFAYPSTEEAMLSFKARKRRQVAILEYKLSRASMALALAIAENGEGDDNG